MSFVSQRGILHSRGQLYFSARRKPCGTSQNCWIWAAEKDLALARISIWTLLNLNSKTYSSWTFHTYELLLTSCHLFVYCYQTQQLNFAPNIPLFTTVQNFSKFCKVRLVKVPICFKNKFKWRQFPTINPLWANQHTSILNFIFVTSFTYSTGGSLKVRWPRYPSSPAMHYQQHDHLSINLNWWFIH